MNQKAEEKYFEKCAQKMRADAALRERLLTATHDCVAENGFSATSTDAIARRAGISAGTLFRLYPNKGELLRAALERARQQLRGGGPMELEGSRVYDQLRDLWDRASQNALAAPAAFHYWRLYRATPMDTEWGFPANMRLGPFNGVPTILSQTVQSGQWNELSGWLAAAQWVAAVHFVLAPLRAPLQEVLNPKIIPTHAQVLAHAFEAFWNGLQLDKNQLRLHYAYIY